jgi:hypothetical protein
LYCHPPPSLNAKELANFHRSFPFNMPAPSKTSSSSKSSSRSASKAGTPLTGSTRAPTSLSSSLASLSLTPTDTSSSATATTSNESKSESKDDDDKSDGEGDDDNDEVDEIVPDSVAEGRSKNRKLLPALGESEDTIETATSILEKMVGVHRGPKLTAKESRRAKGIERMDRKGPKKLRHVNVAMGEVEVRSAGRHGTGSFRRAPIPYIPRDGHVPDRAADVVPKPPSSAAYPAAKQAPRTSLHNK